jgi:hypothetical protein
MSSKVTMLTMYEVMVMAKQYDIPEYEVLLCLFAQGQELSTVACSIANKILYNL